MLSLEEIKKRLEIKILYAVAEETGLHYNTVRKYARGEIKRPSYHAISKLSEYLSRDPMEG